MTIISKPEQSGYGFQFNESLSSKATKMISIKTVLDTANNESDQVVVRGKITHMTAPSVASQYQLKLVNAVFADGSGTITLDLWEQHISTVTVGNVYTSFSPVQIRLWQSKKKLSTLSKTVITVEDKSDTEAFAQIQIDVDNDEV